MRISSFVWLVIVLILLVGTVYYFWIAPASQTATNILGSAGSSTPGLPNTSGTSTSSSSPSSTGQPIVLSVGTDAALGDYLVATNGMTLYRYTRDTANTSNCSGTCATQWPPYAVSSTSSSTLRAASGVAGAVSSIRRADGSMQVTYNGMPLYFWYKDARPGDTTGQNVGGVWFVVKP